MKTSLPLKVKRLEDFKPYLLPGGLLFLTLGLLVLSFLGVLPRILSGRKAISSQRKGLAELQSKRALLEDLARVSGAISGNLELVEAALPSEPRVPNFLGQLQAAALACGLTMEGLQYAGASPSERASSSNEEVSSVQPQEMLPVGVQMIVNGTYNEAHCLLDAIERMRRLVEVATLRFDRRKTEGEVYLSTSLGLLGYYVDPARLIPNQPLEFNQIDFRGGDVGKVLEYLKSATVYAVDPLSQPVGRDNPFAGDEEATGSGEIEI